MKKIIDTARKMAIGTALATLVIATAIPTALFLSFVSKDRRKRTLGAIDLRVQRIANYINRT